MTVPRMRTLPETIKMLRAADPDTAITITALRRMVRRKEIRVTLIASKPLINFDALLSYLQQPAELENETYDGDVQCIRQIAE